MKFRAKAIIITDQRVCYLHSFYLSVVYRCCNFYSTSPVWRFGYITLTASSGNRDVTVWRPSVCPDGILTVDYQRAACDAASVHIGPTIRRTDVLVGIVSISINEVAAKAPSAPVTMSKQHVEATMSKHHCRMLQSRTILYTKSNVPLTKSNVASTLLPFFGNKVERVFREMLFFFQQSQSKCSM